MSLKLRDITGDIFNNVDFNKVANIRNTIRNTFGGNTNNASRSSNPYLNSNGELANPNLDYQKMLDSSKLSQTVKDYISQATGIEIKNASGPGGIPFASRIIPLSGTSSSSTSSGTSGNSIADAAKNYLGTPYVWGGSSAEHGGMDCSGFVYNALKDAGYNVGRTSAQGYRNGGEAVSKSDMKPGDLIFYGKGSEATHVAVYIGDGKMIHSSGGGNNTASNPGKGVTVSDVNYRSDFIEARRY